MTRCLIISFVLLVIITSLGCSKSGDPALPDSNRNAEVFTPTAQPIFGTGTSGNWQPHFHDIALAQILIVGGNPPGIPLGGNNSCVAVTLNRPNDTDPAGRFKPIFRWLDNTDPNNPGVNGGPFWVTLRDFTSNGADDADYRSVSCDAAWDLTGAILDLIDPPGQKQTTLELLVCYQVKLPGSPSWNLGVTALQWRGANATNYWLNQPDDRWDIVLPNAGLGNDDVNPDIAYNHLNGDVYLVWSNVEDDPNFARIKYVHYTRLGNTISPEYYAQTVEAGCHNGFDPSIDVDRVTFGSTQYWVAIAYTSQFKGGQMGFHVCYTGFPAGVDGNHNTTTDLRYTWAPISNFNAGVPSIDISPNSGANHIVAVAFEQIIGTDGFGPITSIFVAQVQTMGPPQFFQVPTVLGSFDGMYPSMAIEFQNSPLDPITACVTFMAQQPQTSASLGPYARRVQLVPNLALVGNGNNVAPPGSITGNFNTDEIPFINPGMSTAIVTLNDSSYWAAWCDRTEMEPPPQQVWASWGFIN